MSTPRRRTVTALAAAVLVAACGTADGTGGTADGIGTTGGSGDATLAPPEDAAEDPGEDPESPEGDDPEDSGDDAAQAAIERMLAMDPSAMADAHEDVAGGENRPNSVDPERIVIPAIGVDADVIDLGLQPDGSLEVPTDYAQTGWYENGPRPGRVGPAVIAGHVNDRSGPAVFARLGELEPGDEIAVSDDEGTTVTFVVRETQQHPKDDFPTDAVYGGTAGPELRLITCSGEFDTAARSHRDNTIVFAERVDA